MNNDTDPKEPTQAPEVPQEVPQPGQPLNSTSDPLYQSDSPSTESQWQTKEAYKENRENQATESAPPDATKLAKVHYWSTLALGVSTVFFLLSLLTPLGTLIALEPGSDISRPTGAAHPLIALSIIAMAASYLMFTVVGIMKAQKLRKSSALYITLLVIGVVLVANPIGFFILLFAVSCNLNPCSGT